MRGIKFVLCTIVLFSGVLCGKVCGQTGVKYTGEKAAGFARSAVNFGVVVSATPSVVCENEKVEFAATLQSGDAGPYTYRWYKNGSVVSTTASFTKSPMRLADAGEYCCVVTNRSGETVYSDTIKYVVHPIPLAEITVPSQDTKVCYGDTLVLQGRSNVQGAVFSWSGPGLTGSTGSSSVKAFPTEYSRYVFQVEANGCSSVDSVKVRVVRPSVDVPYVLNVSEGATASITATDASGAAISPATGLTWTTNVASVAGANVNPFSVKGTAALSRVYVSYNLEGCVVSDSVMLNTKGSASFAGGENDGFARSTVNFGVKVSATPSVVCENEKVEFAATLQSGDAGLYTYKWYKDGSVVSTTASFTKSPMRLSDAGEY
ncbi:MAG: immunoglobulin domain-containing protein, partial [Odoribacter sp.]|nr:immunoglobulin domain-containing protein [Odoribacter sp.]